jgi:hypothetical protein
VLFEFHTLRALGVYTLDAVIVMEQALVKPRLSTSGVAACLWMEFGS